MCRFSKIEITPPYWWAVPVFISLFAASMWKTGKDVVRSILPAARNILPEAATN